MPSFIFDAAFILLFTIGMALINRFRGVAPVLPFSNKYLAWAMAGILAYVLTLDLIFSITVALGYLVWYWPGWMRWVSMGKTTPAFNESRPLTWDEITVDAIVWAVIRRYSARVGLFVRGALFLLPLVIALGLQGLNVAPFLIILIGFVPAYILGWKYGPVDPVTGQDPCVIGEPIAGALMGLSIALAFVLPHFFAFTLPNLF